MATRGWENVEPGGLDRRRTAATSPPPPRKYRNQPIEVGGIRFDSKAEANVWLKLRDREARKEIYDLQRQVHFALKCPIETTPDLTAYVAHYIADFTYCEAGVRHVIDVKREATRTAIYKLKAKWLQLQTGICIEEVSG